jgi:hypothetical protein
VAKKVYVHVGLPKSGTSYLQAVFADNKARLERRAHVLYPGATWADQVLAARDVLSANPHGLRDPAVQGAWQRLVDEVAEWDGDCLVSMEWLGSAEPGQVRRIVETLAPARVEIIVTIRDIARTVPAAWQEFVQNWELWSWPEFLSAVTSDSPRGTPAGNLFWAQQDIGRVLAIWGDVLAAEQLHVVTVGQPGATAANLWLRVAEVMGVDGSLFDASGRGSNESLGLESAELMLRLNQVSRARGLEWPVYNEMFKHALAKRGLSKRRHRESRLRLPKALEPWARAKTAEQIRAIEASGAAVVGDLDDLQPVFDANGDEPADVNSVAVLDAALDGLVALAKDRFEDAARLRGRLDRLRAEKAREDEDLTAMRGELERATTRPVRFALVRLSEQRAWLGAARRAYQRVARLVPPKDPTLK